MKDVPINKLININGASLGVMYPDPTASDIPTALNVGLLAFVFEVLIMARLNLYQVSNTKITFRVSSTPNFQRFLTEISLSIDILISCTLSGMQGNVPDAFSRSGS